MFAVDVEPMVDNDEINKTWQLQFVDDPHTASVFIMNDCSKARTSVICRVSLVGGVLLSTTAYTGFGKSGVVMQHEASLKPKKTWFVSKGFRDECPDSQIDSSAHQLFGFADMKSVLADISKKDKLISRSKRRCAAGYGTEFVFVTSKAERHYFNPKELKHVLHFGKLTQ